MASIVERKSKNGSSYKVVVRVKGYNTKTKTFGPKEYENPKREAKLWASEIETAMKRGTYIDDKPIIQNTEIKTVGDLIEYFRENEGPHRYQRYDKYQFIYDWWIDKIGELKISDLTPAILSNCKNLLANEKMPRKNKGSETRSSSTINKYLFALSAIIEFGIDEFNLWEYNPMSRVKKRKKDKQASLRVRFLSEEEIAKVKAGARNKNYRFYVFILLAMVTGARFSIVLHLNIKDFNFKKNEIYLLYNKARNNIGFPVSVDVMNEVKNLIETQEIHDGYLFWNKRTNNYFDYKSWFEKLIKELEINDFRFHDIRHTAVSYFLMSGGNENAAMELFGWSSREMLKRYGHLTKGYLREFAQKASKVFMD